MHDFPHPKDRIRRILQDALADCAYVSSRSEDDGTLLLLRARRMDGTEVNVRFRGVRESEATAEPAEGSPLKLKRVSNSTRFSLLGVLLPILRTPGPQYARVTIESSEATLNIVCQDVEWWEDGSRSG